MTTLMGIRASRVAVCAVLVVAAGLCAAGLVLLAATWSVPSGPALSGPVATLGYVLASASFGIVGALIAWNRPSNLIGWLCLATALVAHYITFARYLAYTLVAEPDASLPSLRTMASVAEHLWVLPMGCLVALLIVFPGGRPASRGMTIVAWSIPAIVAAALAAGAVKPGVLPEPLDRYRNELGVEGFGLAAELNVAFLLAFSFVAAVAAVDMVRRLVRSTGEERQQFKWFAYATAGIPVLMVVWFSLDTFEPDAVHLLELGFAFLLISIPVAIGIAVLKYRLYDIDLLISRTLVYGLLTVGLGAVYVALVLAGQAVFSSFAGGGDLAIAVSTLVVAALFLPLRSRVQRFVDRRFYRRRYDAQRTLEAFGTRLRDQVELDALRADLAGVVREAVEPAHVSVWLRNPAGVGSAKPADRGGTGIVDASAEDFRNDPVTLPSYKGR